MSRDNLVEHRTASGVTYFSRGSGRPLIFVHGWCLNRAMWCYAEAAFSDRFEVITPDLSGFGRSAGLAGPYSLARHAADLAEVIADVSARDPVVIGFAYGAMVALELARISPELIGSVVAIGLPDNAASPYAKMPRAMQRDWPDFARRSANALFHKPQSEATIAWLEDMFRSAPLTVGVEVVHTLAAYDPVAGARASRVPVLFVNGSEDGVAPLATGKSCAAACANGKLEVIADCGHLIPIDQKEAFHAVVEQHLAG